MSSPPPALDEVRRNIDELDRRIIALIAERQSWVVRAGALKTSAIAVRAPDRVEQVICSVRGLAREFDASPEVVEAAYRAMIAAFIDLEMSVRPRA